ncbi:17574_t:CDS:2 [Entrophospora sp. SA101]|nr:17574_t:CDS:2 [Entrophospora sp. SA101]
MSKEKLTGDCLRIVLKELEEDKDTLYSCLLVNKLWCELTVEVLWSQPFRITRSSPSSKLIEIYMRFLSAEQIQKIKQETGTLLINEEEYNDDYDYFGATVFLPMFDYPIFLKNLSYLDLYISVSKWFNLYDKWCEVYRERVAILSRVLLEMFMLKSNSLVKLSIETGDMFMVKNNHLNVFGLPGSDECLAKLKQFTCIGDFLKYEIFLSASKTSRNIKTLYISPGRVGALHEHNVPQRQIDNLIELIKVQKNLEHLALHSCNQPNRLVGSLMCLLDQQIHSLRHLEFILFSFNISNGNNNDIIDFTPLTGLKNLETLTFESCKGIKNLMEVFSSRNELKNLKKLSFKNTIMKDNVLAEFIENSKSLSTLHIGPIEINDPTDPINIFDSLEHLIIHADWCFSSYDLLLGLKGCRAKLKTFKIPDSYCLNDSHLFVIAACLGESLKYLDISYASPSQITGEGLSKVRSVIERVDYRYKKDRKYSDFWNLRFWGENWVEEPIIGDFLEQD